MEYTSIIATKADGIATITLNRPTRLNAMLWLMAEELLDALEDVRRDEGVRVLVLTGAGRAFCAGGDIDELMRAGFDTSPMVKRENVALWQRVVSTIHRLEKPVIAAVNGPAMGGGCNLALACDIRIAADTATFGEVFVKTALTPDMGGTYLLPRLVGLGKAMEMILTGDVVDAREAERLGLVNRVVALAELEGETTRLARRLADGPTRTLALAKLAVLHALSSDFDGALHAEAQAQALCFESEDHHEGVQAFLGKRQPHFQGR